MKENLFSVNDCIYGLEYLEGLGFYSRDKQETLEIMFNRLNFLKSQGLKNRIFNYKRIKDLNDCVKYSANEILQENYEDYAFSEQLKGDKAMPLDDLLLVAYTEHYRKEKAKDQEKDIR